MSSSAAPALTSSLTSLVDLSEQHEPWTKLNSKKGLGCVHATYWGKSMADEETAWRAKQEPRMPTDEDNDILPHCYYLDFCAEGLDTILGTDGVWIRADYFRIYDFLENFYNEKKGQRENMPAAVLTGQPGIGKSYWLYYALRRCLAERRPVIWPFYGGRHFYIFVEDGVYRMGTGFAEADYKMHIWTLIDSDDSYENNIIQHHVATKFFVIYSTSPADERLKRLRKIYRKIHFIVMNPWTRGEIHQVATIRSPEANLDIIDDAFNQFGPTPRVCLDIASTPDTLAQYQATVRSALLQLDLKRLRELAEAVEHLNIDDVSHRIFLVMREDTEIESRSIMKPITDQMQSRLARELWIHDSQEQIYWYRLFARRPSARGLGGHLFEAFCQQRFRNQIKIECFPLVRLDDRDDMTRKPKWHTSHTSLSGELEVRRRNALDNSISLNIANHKTREYNHLELEGLAVEPDTFYIPTAENAEAVDSFICLNNQLFFFQFTVSSDHDIKPGFVSQFAKCNNLPPRENWFFIFILPDDVGVLKCRYPKDQDLQNLKIFSSQVKLEAYGAKEEEEEEEEEGPTKRLKLTVAPAEGSMASERSERQPVPRNLVGSIRSKIFKGKERQM